MIGNILNKALSNPSNDADLNWGINVASIINRAGAKTITKYNVMSNSSIVFACINKISSTIAQMSIDLIEEKNDEKKIIKNELTRLLKRPMKMYGGFDFMQTLVAIMLVYGESYAYINCRNGTPYELLILPVGTCTLKYGSKYRVITMIDNTPYSLDPDEVIRITDIKMDGIHPVNRIDCLTNKLNIQLRGENMIKDFYENNGGIKGFFETPSKLGREAKTKIKEEAMNIITKGVSGIGVLDADLKFNNIGNSSIADTQFLDNLKLTKEDICSVFDINPALVGASEKATNSNMQEMTLEFVKSLIGLITKIEQELSYKLLTPKQQINSYFRINQACALRADDKTRAEYLVKMKDGGLMTINEARRVENLNPVEGGDELRVDLNHVSLSKVDEYQLLRAKRGGGKNNEE